jgi:hypothetical protein
VYKTTTGCRLNRLAGLSPRDLVEIIEYLLVFGVTAVLAGFSVLVFGGSLPTLHQTQDQAELDQIAGAAGLAAENGTATLALPLSNATISCSDGIVELSTGGGSFSAGIGASCGFSVSGLNGLCTLLFTRSSSGVALEVET